MQQTLAQSEPVKGFIAGLIAGGVGAWVMNPNSSSNVIGSAEGDLLRDIGLYRLIRIERCY
jgi:hypothetical protein